MSANPVPQLQPKQKQYEIAATKIANETNTDVFLYNSEIKRHNDWEVIDHCTERRRRKKVMVILVTEGGDPNAAYRMARCFQQNYDHFTCIVPGYCKSAGTLIAIGADELVFFEGGELGPLDVQMSKKDELWEMQSGLTVMTALRPSTRSHLQLLSTFSLRLSAEAAMR